MFKKLIRQLARPEIFVYSCIWLLVLLVLGTWAQRSIGLYRAQDLYFSSWVFMTGPIPLPGGRVVEMP